MVEEEEEEAELFLDSQFPGRTKGHAEVRH
jgi:hypothetical protein